MNRLRLMPHVLPHFGGTHLDVELQYECADEASARRLVRHMRDVFRCSVDEWHGAERFYARAHHPKGLWTASIKAPLRPEPQEPPSGH